ncbi:hypothetical protein J2Y58_003848 [Sphingomonas sp. BE138]|uniref:hypothetical protein n=1 Tax=Sphingomonas sp. BE138 TaxID=2817845 RepID=UPI002854568D|nr:hypothetical protein [Sphingomonas sp. BE138]MDR6790465.1 hypothetical protein [Sphingomonas sp. BE138]
MERTVFWSWQSDLDGRVTRELVRSALDQAIGMISAELDEADRPSLTSDTQGVAGSPDIVATILRKIDEAAVFVGDVTPIAVSADGKACANPNVLIELGYAHRALGDNRVLQVWNTAFDGATIDKLPFDMRGRRGPIAFHLPDGADREELRRVRADLAKRLAEYLRLALDQLPAPPPEAVHWQPHFAGDPDLWFDRTQPILVTHPSHGTSRVRWMDKFPGYARLIPSRWVPKPGAKEALASNSGHPALIARANALGYGISRGGTMIYWPGTEEDGAYPTLAITQWFEKTGEFWGVGGGFLFDREGRITLATGYFFKHWLHFLERNSRLALDHGGSLPIHVRLGVNGLANSWWPLGRYSFSDEGFGAVEDTYEYVATLTSIDPDHLKGIVADAFNGLAAIYGMEPQTFEQIAAAAR